MKYIPHAIAFFLTVSLTSGQTMDSSKIPEKLRRLRANYNTAVERVVTPLKRTYETELQRLKIDYTKAGDLESALAVDAEIKALSDKPEVTKPHPEKTCKFIDTTWRNDQSGNVLEFKSDGQFSESEGSGNRWTGTWEIVTDTEVTVTRSDKTTWHFYILRDGSTTRKGFEGFVWRPLNTKKNTEQDASGNRR